jgi:hypothetical protein
MRDWSIKEGVDSPAGLTLKNPSPNYYVKTCMKFTL